MNDEDSEVLEAALETGGKLKDPRLWPRILECLISSKTRRAAFSALVVGGESSLPFLEKSFQANFKNYEMDLQLVRLFGQIGGGKAINILADNVSFPNEEVRHQILHSLAMINYQASKSKKGEILANIHTEIKNAVWMLAALVDIREEDQSDLLKRALNYSLFKSRERVLWLLSFIYGSKDVLRAKVRPKHSCPKCSRCA